MNVSGGRYDQNVTRLMADYSDFIIRGCESGFGWEAWTRGAGNRPLPPRLEASSCDELADKMDACRRRVDGA